MLHRKKPARPHPRSLDALFPKPKKPPLRLCPKGHRQGVNYVASAPCVACRLIEVERAQALAAQADREEFSRRNKVGPSLRHLVVKTGRVVTHAIPGWAQALKKRQDAERRRRPRRRSRVSPDA